MGFIFGKYFIYLKFEDGSSGYFMHMEGDHVMVTKDVLNAEKYMTENGARNYFYSHDIASGYNSNFSPVMEAKIYTDGKYFRM